MAAPISSSFALLLICFALLYSLPYLYFVLRALLCPPPGPAPDPQRPAASRVAAVARARARRSYITFHGSLIALCAALVAGLSPYAVYREFDPYAVLGVERGVTEKGLATAFRRLSLKHHPDKGGDRATFQQLKRAYDVLTKEEERRNFAAFGNPEGKVQDKFGDMAGASQRSKSAMLLGYVGVLGAVVVYLVRGGAGKENGDEEELKGMSDDERTLRRALAAVDVVPALRGRNKSGVPERNLEEEVEEEDGRGRRGGGGGARREASRAAAERVAAARAAAGAPPPFSLPPGVEFFDFFEPRFEQVALSLPAGAFPPFGSAATPREDAEMFYAAWRGAGARLKVVDYANLFEKQMEKRIGREKLAEDYTSQRDAWRVLLYTLKLDPTGCVERRAAEAGRLEDLLAAARSCDPRLPKEAPALAKEGGAEGAREGEKEEGAEGEGGNPRLGGKAGKGKK
jgi:curved DNA-binding protein CbpA